jgi:CHAT domain-containing protein
MRDRDATHSRSESRPRAFALVCASSLLALCACTGSSRTDPVELFVDSIQIQGAAPTTFTRSLSAGAYLLEVREHEIDLQLSVDAGGVHTELKDQVPRHGALYEVVRLNAPAELRVKIASDDHPTKKGLAKLRLSQWKRAFDAPPSELELGYDAYAAAGHENALATPEAWTRAADKMYEAVTHFDVAGDDAARAQAAYSLANIQYNARDAWVASVRATEMSADAYDAVGDEVGIQNSATLRAAAEIEIAAAMDAGTQQAEQKAMYASADRRLAEAAEFFTRQGLPVRAEYAVNMRAVRAVNVGDYETADELFSQAVKLARANHDVAEEAKSLANLAAIHIYRGQMMQAASEYEALLPMVDGKSQPYQYAVLLANYGFALVAIGDFDRALQLHLQALDLYTKAGEEEERATELLALGGLYLRMGDAARALETLRSAITVQKRLSDNIGLASSLRVAGNAASALGDHEGALEYLRESARIDANPHQVARTRVLIAGELRALRKYDAAQAELAGLLQSGSELVRASALEERARLQLARGTSKEVADDLRTADRLYTSLGLEFNRIDTNTQLSRVLLAQGDVAGAAVAADEAVAIVTRIRSKSANPEWRARFLSSRYAPFEARIAVELAAGDKNEVDAAWQAFRTAEEVRARSLADELAFAAPGKTNQSGDPEAALRARLTSQQMRLESRVQRQDPDEAGTMALRRAIEETRAQIDSIRLQHGAVTAREHSFADSLQQVQRRLPADTAVLAYFVGDEQSHGWLLTREGLRHARLGGSSSIVAVMSRAVQGGRTGSDESAMRELGSGLLGSLLNDVRKQRLLVIADGPLNAVPFAALPLPGSGGALLVDRFVLSYAPSLALVLQTPRRENASRARVAVVSDPVYAADDRRLASVDRGGTLRGAAPRSQNNLTRLPYSALEAAAVTRAFGAPDIIQLAGFDATPAKVLQLRSNKLAVLHFATHAVARSDAPEQSALFLTEYSPDGTLLPSSRLTASEIRRSGLHADVVVLSGCATGDGNELRGEGVLGLTYGFLANGSHSVVASLWPIEDASTARFMSEFYKAYRSSGRTAEALRVAQLRFRAGTASTVWSSFVVRANEFP